MPKRNKLGLALSGGGFRASFFHIGVLAQLAELDLLRPIEVVSTVSGGSIVGALYYLRVKKLLESAPDNKITPHHYVEMVKSIEEDFLEGVQQNLRTRAYADFGKNWKMIRSREYSRSDRMAELYDEYFYDRVAAHPRIALSELKIQPPDGPKDFYPRKHNVHRTAKVPSLIINATTLNSGRNWQFSVVDAGEHEDGKAQEQRQSDDYDKSVLFRAFRYDAKGIPDKYRKIPLSVAVAASACVPGIFPPLALTGLYPNATPKLVDGGVFDNQGTSALLYEKCTDILISDASGQMDDEAKPPSSLLSVLLRTNSISMDRIRDSGFLRLSELGKSGALSRYISFHLKEDFGVDKLDPGQYKKEPKELAVQNPISYGINGEAQLQLAKIRTDLDSFTEIESRSLMYSGYAIAKQRVPGDWQDVFSSKKDFMKKIHRRQQQVWDFEEVRSHLEKPFEDAEFSRQLSIGRETMFKAFRLMPRLIPLGVLIGLIAVIGPLLLLGALWYGISFFSLWDFVIGIVVLSMVSGAVAAAVSTRWLRVLWEDFVLQIIVTSAAALFGSLAAKLHLRWIDPKFVAQGTLDRIGASRRE